jgi:hypothetical protein
MKNKQIKNSLFDNILKWTWLIYPNTVLVYVECSVYI